VFLYLHLEFQSEDDWWMPVRVVAYEALLLQQIIAEQKLPRGALLPPVLTIVLYNGPPDWKAPAALSDLIALPPDSPLWPWQPQGRYYLLKATGYPREQLRPHDNMAALLFRLEQRQKMDELGGLLDDVVDWFRRHPELSELRKIFTELVRQAIKAAGVTTPIPAEMQEIRTMITTLGATWREEWIGVGREEGKKEGKKEGKEEGKKEGKKEGKAELLLRQFMRRFGTPAPEVEARVRAAESGQLDAWGERLIDAPTAADVFRA